jgi:hypothetical protein
MRDARNWQGPRARARRGRPAGKSRRPLVWGIVFVMLALGGVLAGLVYYLKSPPQPLLVVIRLDQYRDPQLPVSPWGDQDRAALRDLSRVGLKEQSAFTSQERHLLLQELDAVGRNQPTNQPLVIYLCAYAVGTENGGVSLLPADALLDEPKSWLPLTDVLAAIKACPVKRKLLLLDVALPCTTPRGGLLTNDVPERLAHILEPAVQSTPDLQVLTACSPGQVSLASEEMGHTVFAYYVAQGLLGHADGCLPNRPADRHVSVQELQSYVKAHVDHWAWHNRGLRQTPVFYGSGADYALTTVGTPPDPEPTPLPREYPTFLKQPWQQRDAWWKDHTSRTPARLYRELEADALRAEEHWRGGEDAGKVQSFLDPRVKRLNARRDAEKISAGSGQQQSLAQQVATGRTPPTLTDEDRREFKELARVYVLANQPKPNEKDVAFVAKETERITKKYDGRSFDLAWTVFTLAAETPPPQESLRCWYGLLQPEGKPAPDYVETRFLKSLITDIKVEKPADWPADTVTLALQLAGQAEKVEAGNPQLQPWLKNSYAAAVRKRRAAEGLLFDTNAAKRATALTVIQEALAQFRTLGNDLDTLNDAQRLRDEALVFLPTDPVYLEFEPANEKVWEDAARTTRELDDLLGQTIDDAALSEALGHVRELALSNLSISLSKLREPLRSPLVQKVIDESQPASAADAVKMSVLLQLSAPSAAERTTLWNNYRALAGRLHAETVATEQSVNPLPTEDAVVAVRKERERALLRARASLTLLKLAKAADADKVEAQLQKVQRAPTEEAAWQSLARALRQAWKQHDIDRAKSEKN